MNNQKKCKKRRFFFFDQIVFKVFYFSHSGACELDMVMTGLVFAGAQVLHLLLHHIWAISIRKKIYISFPKACLFTMFEQFQFTKKYLIFIYFFQWPAALPYLSNFNLKRNIYYFSLFSQGLLLHHIWAIAIKKNLLFLPLFRCKACPGSPYVVTVGGVPFCPDRDSTSLREYCTEIYLIKNTVFSRKNIGKQGKKLKNLQNAKFFFENFREKYWSE